MITVEVQEAIIKNIQEFSDDEKRKFRKCLVDEAYYDADLIDMINITEAKDYWSLDTAVRDHYIDAFLKMHISK